MAARAWGKQNSNLNVLDGGFHACAGGGAARAGRACQRGARGGDAVGRPSSAGPGAGAGARARARWTRAGRLLVDRTVHLFRLTWLHLEAKITPRLGLQKICK